MTQIVKFPDKVWARLATIAERREMTIAELLVETAQRVLEQKLAPEPVDEAPEDLRPWLPAMFQPELVAKVRELYDMHRSREHIAEELGLPYDEVRVLCNHLGLMPRRKARPKLVDEDWFRELYALKWSDRAIADRMGVADVTIGRTRRSLGLPSNGQPGRPSKNTTNQEHAA